MNTQPLIAVTLLAAIPVALVLMMVFPPRLRAGRRARELLARHPSAKQTSVYVAFASAWPSAKHQQIDGEIKEMSRRGWTFLRSSEASPLRTLCSWGGGVNLHFIRIDDKEAKTAA